MKGAEPDLSAATFQIFDETHTLGNALRWMIMKKCVRSCCAARGAYLSLLCSPKVEFCGYRCAPYPSYASMSDPRFPCPAHPTPPKTLSSSGSRCTVRTLPRLRRYSFHIVPT
jgi:DNA-directed RNA polymerase subunit L